MNCRRRAPQSEPCVWRRTEEHRPSRRRGPALIQSLVWDSAAGPYCAGPAAIHTGKSQVAVIPPCKNWSAPQVFREWLGLVSYKPDTKIHSLSITTNFLLNVFMSQFATVLVWCLMLSWQERLSAAVENYNRLKSNTTKVWG